ncbi:DUF1127 domain-containing protein [Shimia sediminis]|uniref:DUF1127 domain-containing protein n=1 Tax=Shimia sediminis TaxID=2497945 RepID=UPI000F8CE522|nr:DUF1127 domain-containing protein [Shimia sediminis]
MAHTAHHTGFGASVLHVLAAPFVALGRGMVALGEASSRQKRVTYLNSLTDNELAEMGLRREDIVLYVFRDCAGY